MRLMSPGPRGLRAAIAPLVLFGVIGMAATPARAADGLRPTVKLGTAGSGTGIGDFNGDGLDDVVTDQGGAIIFGSRTPAPLDLSQSLGTKGVRLRATGGSVAPYASPIGDIDRDGFDDIAARVAENPEIFIVYGAAGIADIELRSGPRVGIVTSPRAGIVDRLGDWDGDGIDDFTVTRNVGNSYGGTSTNVNQGVAVIRGGARITSLSALTPGPRVQPITAAANCQLLPQFFWLRLGCAWRWQNSTPIGDFDGDGKADLFIRTIDRSWILRGRASTAAIDAIRPTDAIEVQGATPNTTGSLMAASRLGDLNLDGRSDIAVSGNGDSLTRVVYGRPGTTTITLSAPDITLSGLGAAEAAGDVNGDGRGDVLLFTSSDSAPRYVTDLASRGRQVDAAAQGTLIPGLETPRASAIGDFDGDGKDDLVGPELQLVRWGAIGGAADVFPPQFDVAAPREGIIGRELEILTFLSEPATVRFEMIAESGGAVVGSVVREVAAGRPTVRWIPTTPAGQPVPAGLYKLRAVARDAAGNASPAVESDLFWMRAAFPSSVRANVAIQLPDGQPLTKPVPNAWTVACQAPSGNEGEALSWASIEVPGSSTGEILNGEPGKTCWISIQPPVNIKEISGCRWSSSASIAGRTLLAQPYEPELRHEFVLAAGLNTIDLKVICTGGVRLGDVAPPFGGVGTWKAYGAAPQPQGTDGWRLTPAIANTAGLIASSNVVAPAGFRYSFTAQAAGGNGAAEGLALGFLPESAGVRAGAGGGGLGIGGTGATVVAFDLNRGPSDPGDQFIGISDSTMTGGHLNYQATALAGHRMRGTAFKVDVVYQGGVLTVSTNGKVRLSHTVALPARARIVFSASTGTSIYQEHTVSGFAMTRP